MKQFLFEQILNVEDDDINDKKNIEKFYKMKLNNNIEEINKKIDLSQSQMVVKLFKKKSKVIKEKDFGNKISKKITFSETNENKNEDEDINIDKLKYKLFNILSQNMVFLIKNYKIDEKNSLLPFIYQKTNPYLFRNIIKMFQGYKSLLIERGYIWIVKIC